MSGSKTRVAQGMKVEIQTLLRFGYSWDLPSMHALGYIQWKDAASEEEAITRWKYDEHAYARRQMTWLHKEKDIVWLDVVNSQFKDSIEKLVGNGILKNSMVTKVEVSHKTIVFTLILLASIWFILQIGDLLLLLFLSFILMAGLRPLVDWLEKKRIPRIIAILLMYVLVFGFIGGALASIIPTLGEQSAGFVKELPLFINRTFPAFFYRLSEYFGASRTGG